jgi:L-threonylcarbamoyladenylate synthase
VRTERLLVAVAGAADLAGDPAIRRAATLLDEGRLVAFPTETVYGLGARADAAEAVRGIFRAKGRPATNPLIVHVRDVAAARALTARWPPLADDLARALWPGPLTLVVARREGAVADEVCAGGATVAIRVPAHPVARALLEACRLPIAAPSANASTTLSPTTAAHVLKSLDGRIDACLDAGPTGFGIESTIVDVTRSPAVLLRHGAIAAPAIAARGALVDRAGRVVAAGERAEAPGGHARHYAPAARLVVVDARRLDDALRVAAARGARAGVLIRDVDGGIGLSSLGPREVLPADPAGYASALYAALHRLDDAACDVIFVAAVPEDPAWDAVRDRLARASAPADPEGGA